MRRETLKLSFIGSSKNMMSNNLGDSFSKYVAFYNIFYVPLKIFTDKLPLKKINTLKTQCLCYGIHKNNRSDRGQRRTICAIQAAADC